VRLGVKSCRCNAERGVGIVACPQGFVSNRDSERNEDKADPLEIILYAVFVATSERASVAELAEILQVLNPKP
jgi:hypothetical protein